MSGPNTPPRATLALALLLVAAPAAAATPTAQLIGARAQAQACDLPAALAAARAALAAARAALAAGERETPQDAGFRLLAEQDVATFANGLSETPLAETSAREAVAIATRLHGAGSREWALVAQNLAVALAARGARDEARGLYDRIVRITAAGTDPAAATNAELGYSEFEQRAGRSVSGLAHAERAVALAKAATVPAGLRARAYLRAADAYRRALRFREANAAADEAGRALAAAGGTGGGARLTLVRAGIAFEAGEFSRALALLDTIAAAPADRCDPTLAIDVAHRRGTIHMIRREVPEARLAFTEALAGLAATPLRNDARRPEITYGLAVAASQAREPEVASGLFDRAAADFRQVYGRASVAEVQALQEKALMYVLADRGAEAAAAAEAAAQLFPQIAEPTPIDAAYLQVTLGRAYQAAGRTDVAERALTAAVAGFKDARGSRSFDLAPALNGLGEIALARRKPARAADFFRRALAIQQQWGGESALATGVTLARLAAARAAMSGGRAEALALSAQAIDVVRRRLALGEARPWTDVETERRTARTIVEGDAALVTAGLAPGTPTADPAIVARLFEDSQLANATRTGGAIAQLAARLQEAQGALAADLRRRNDLADEWRAIQDDLVRSLRDGDADDARREALLARQRAVYAELGTLDRTISARDPNVDLVIRSRTVTIAEVQARLAPNERAIATLVGAGGSVVIAIDRNGARANASPLTAARIGEAVTRLRGGLDRARWPSDDLPQVDVAAAHLLYRELLGPVLSDAPAVDTLLVVADGALASIPFATLLTAPVTVPAGKAPDYGAMPWLVRRYAIAGFPSAGALVALRGIVGRTPATGFLGVGDPVLGGTKGRSARSLAALFDRTLAASANNPIANPALLRTMTPLPETRTELTAIRDSLHAPTARLLVGPAATETALRQLDLKPFGVIAFATHGLVAGELAGYAEPALVLTPPRKASPADDGLLSASEIARLDLRAQWVILSACSTAAGDGSPRAEPLSGLARAFFYAGARSLLVTHWAIDSDAAAVTTAATVQRAAGGLKPASALRRTQLDFIEDRDKSARTHPYFWAAFQMIGGE